MKKYESEIEQLIKGNNEHVRKIKEINSNHTDLMK